MASYLDKLRDIIEDWNDVMEILDLNKEHIDNALNEAYSVVEVADYAEEHLLAELNDEITKQLRIEEIY